MKLTHLSLAVMVALGLVACGGSDTDHTKPPTPPTKPDPKPDPKPEDDKTTQDPTGLKTVVGFDTTKKASTGSLQQVRETKASFNRTNNPSDVNRVQATSIVSIPLNPNLHDVVVAQIDAKTHEAWVRLDAIGGDIRVGSPNVRLTAPPEAEASDWKKINVSAYSVAAQREGMAPTKTIQMDNHALAIQVGKFGVSDSNIIFPSTKVNTVQEREAYAIEPIRYESSKHPFMNATTRWIKNGDAYLMDKVKGRLWDDAVAKAENTNVNNQYLGAVWLDHLGRSIASEDNPKTKAGVRVMGHKYLYNEGNPAKGHFKPNSFSQASVVTLEQKGKVAILDNSKFDKFANIETGLELQPDPTGTDAQKALHELTKAGGLAATLDTAKSNFKATPNAANKLAYENALKAYNLALAEITWERDRYALALVPMTLDHVQYGRVTGRLDDVGRVRYVQVNNKWILEHSVANKNSKESVDTYFYRGLGATSPENMAKLKAANENAKLVYKGHALMYGISNAFGDDNAIPNATGNSPGHGVGHLVEATFDVGQQKVVDGIVYNAWLTDTSNAKSFTKDVLVKFEGDVTGNTVLGDSWLAKNDKAPKGDFRGSFYGPSAAELGGAFNSVRSPKEGEKDASPYGPYGWGGVFGAKRAVVAPTVGVIPKFEDGK